MRSSNLDPTDWHLLESLARERGAEMHEVDVYLSLGP